jgi:predicted ribosome quality control (RQC) complex YloA/Tae2 family protein
MLQNYFVLNRFILEANLILKNFRIEEIFSQEKSKLIVAVSNEEKEYFIEFCVIPGNSFLNLKKNYARAKKNTVNFFSEAIGETINEFQIANDDRIIKIQCSNSDIFFAIRGKLTNVWFKHNQKLDSFKSIDNNNSDEIKKEFSDKKFISDWNKIELNDYDQDNYLDYMRKKYPFFGTEIIKEVKTRATSMGTSFLKNTLQDVLKEIKTTRPCLFINEKEKEAHLGFENFTSFPFTEKIAFSNVSEAINSILSKKYYLQDKYSKEKLIRHYLERELRKVTNKIQSLQGLIERGSKEEEYNKLGKLLLANLSSIKSRMDSIVVEDIFSSGEKIKINLNPVLSPKKNVDYYFDKSKAERLSYSKSQQLFKKAKEDFERLKQIENSLDKIESTKELDELMKKLKIKEPQQTDAKDDLSSKFRQYLIEGKYRVYVGKDSNSNDLLTTRFAKPNDYWFHARGASGSHVVLRVENTKEPIPKNILKKAAAIAAYHSKAKTSGTAPVAFTLKKYVVKKKGDPSGTVRLLREDVLMVKPEVPAGCEYNPED